MNYPTIPSTTQEWWWGGAVGWWGGGGWRGGGMGRGGGIPLVELENTAEGVSSCAIHRFLMQDFQDLMKPTLMFFPHVSFSNWPMLRNRTAPNIIRENMICIGLIKYEYFGGSGIKNSGFRRSLTVLPTTNPGKHESQYVSHSAKLFLNWRVQISGT